ncbi:MAG: hypothetical protein ACPGLV_00330 [Bacteroidia bacterium]
MKLKTKIDLKTLVHSKSRFLADRKSKNQNLGGKRRAITQLIFNAGLAAGAKLSFSSLFLASVESETLRKPALNMSRERYTPWNNCVEMCFEGHVQK